MAVVKVAIEAADCISCEQCVSECEQVFEMGEEVAVVKPEAQDPEFCKQHTEGILAAANSCPSEAIKYTEE